MNNNANKELLCEYDDFLIGKRTAFSERFFGDDKKINMKNAIYVIRYAVETYLGWTYNDVCTKMTSAIMKDARLDMMMKYVEYPVEYDKTKDFYYLATLMYKEHALSPRDKTIHTYERILTGEVPKYPKDYFSGKDGITRACFCLQYVIDHFACYDSINDLYYLFATKKGVELLKKYKLYNVFKSSFETPIDYLQLALPPRDRNTLFFMYYKYKYLNITANSSISLKKRALLSGFRLKEGDCL